MKVIVIGPAYPLRGGLASFDQRLCRAFLEEGHDCSIYSFHFSTRDFFFPERRSILQTRLRKASVYAPSLIP